MFRTASNFDKLLEKATSNLLLEPDWPTTLQICDLIRQNDVQPKYVISTIKKKLYSQNPHCAMFALQVLESVVKNCGAGIHNEIASKDACEMFRELAKTSPHENVRQKILELIQAWAFAFRNQPKYRAVQDMVNIMKTEGYKFPALKESDAMFSADSAPEWSDGAVCHRCRVAFGLVQRKHHCRACGQVFCAQCSQKTATIPKFGIEKEVRVCDACYDQLAKPTTTSSSKAAAAAADSELPAEYLNSSLAQQNQTPPTKTEAELREEEELQLALALSKSEAEHKEKEKKRITSNSGKARSYSPPPPVPDMNVSPKNEDPVDPELARYLNRSYWEQRQTTPVSENRITSPSAPAQAKTAVTSPPLSPAAVGSVPSDDPEMEDFVMALRSQVEIFVNRMKSNSSRGRSIANDSSVQTLFLNITAMHSRLLRYIQQQDDERLRFEGLQDKLAQVKDARAALDALREEYRERLRREAEEAERLRQLQMAQKLEIMRKKKQEYLQYQRQLALQRIKEQEREMQMRQEQQKQQYIMGPQYPTYIGSPLHNAPGQYPGGGAPPPVNYGGFPQQFAGTPSHPPHQMGAAPGVISSMSQSSMGIPPQGVQGLTSVQGFPQNQSRQGQVQLPSQNSQSLPPPAQDLSLPHGLPQMNTSQMPPIVSSNMGSTQPHQMHSLGLNAHQQQPGSAMIAQQPMPGMIKQGPPPIQNQNVVPQQNNPVVEQQKKDEDSQNQTGELITFD